VRPLGRLSPDGTVVLVEGASDREAVLSLARRLGRDLEGEGVAVTAIGGAHAVARVAALHPGDRLLGLCDEREEPLFRRVLDEVYVCRRDLEEELIRALGADRVVEVIDRLGELAPWLSFQRQPHQRPRGVEAQLRRFMGTHSGRKSLYARALVEALDLDGLPEPLAQLIASV
jgi:hypothetical protein